MLAAFSPIKLFFMTKQKDRHLEAPGEANRDKHINFLAEENGDVDPASENYNKADEATGDDNGFFTDDDNRLQTKEEYDKDKSNHPSKNEKVTLLKADTKTTTHGNKITVNANNEDLVTRVKDNDSEPYINEDDQAH
jgi:hypothetical protein